MGKNTIVSITNEKMVQAVSEANGSFTKAAVTLGIPKSTLISRLERHLHKTSSEIGEMFSAKSEQKNVWTEDRGQNSWTIEASDPEIKTVEDALNRAKVDLMIWEVERVVVNGWDVTMKLKSTAGDKPVTKRNHQIKVFLRRKITESMADAASALLDRMKKHAPKYKSITFKKVADPHLLEISVFDVHFGKLAWGRETEVNYDLHIAEKVYAEAVEDLLSKTNGYNVERILFPIGQDFFHVDNQQNTTVNNTPQDTDGRLAKIFAAGCMACVNAIDTMSQIAPVDVLWSPGNHDRTTSWFLTAYLSAWYRNNKQVNIDLSPKLRKYYQYGTTLLGFTHGDEEKHSDLPAVMAAEAKELWALTSHHEWHLGHLHKKKEMRYSAGDTFVGVPVRILPSLSGTDYWHYKKGYVKTHRAAEAYLWSKQKGYTGHFSSTAKTYEE